VTRNQDLGLASRQYARSSDVTVTHADGSTELVPKQTFREARRATRTPPTSGVLGAKIVRKHTRRADYLAKVRSRARWMYGITDDPALAPPSPLFTTHHICRELKISAKELTTLIS
jgi:hypothetical protein